jgi:hypothetical protein
MQNILILADGHYAERFLLRLAQRRVGENHYVVVTPRPLTSPENFTSECDLQQFDPTSALRLSKLLYAHTFTSVFILMNSDEEARACWDNVRSTSESIEIILLDQWGAFSVLSDSATHVIDAAQIVANRLYDHLPNVPVVAQNVGLGEGEIMEVMVPYGSPFAYRHVGSIAQVKWRIAAVYREGKQILPTHATMIRPQDTLLILGKPAVLENVYRRISQNAARFPEPFGRHLYLILDLDADGEGATGRLQESIHLLERLEENRLYVRLIRPGDFELIETLRGFEKTNERIEVHVQYEDRPIQELILEDVTRYDVGLVMMDPQLFGTKGVAEEMQAHKKLVMLFGDTPLYGIERLVVMMSEEAEMESISSTLFYAAETLDLKPCLCDYDPEGDFEAHRRVVEHYEMLAKIFQYPIKIDQKILNPIRALEEMKHVLQVVPFTPKLYGDDLFRIFSTRLSDYLLESHRHPKLLIPAEEQ